MKSFLTAILFIFSSTLFGAYTIEELADKTVVSAGTAVKLSSSSILTPSVCIQAKHTNTGTIFIGRSTVSSSRGLALSAGQPICFQGAMVPGFDQIDLSTIWIDASSSGDKVHIGYMKYN